MRVIEEVNYLHCTFTGRIYVHTDLYCPQETAKIQADCVLRGGKGSSMCVKCEV